MKNDASKIAMYIAIGALLAVIVLQLMGRLKTERYEGGNSDETDAELSQLLAELEGDEGEGEGEGENVEPAPMGEDSDDEM
jgi:cytochrome c-type biogenesis protein CcmH/NrfG